jgi:CelD/BcsL family acetyltransferase involved in cellulose biosynthesis
VVTGETNATESAALTVAVCDDVAQARALKAEWDGLLAEATAGSEAMSFDYVVPAWGELSKVSSNRLAIVTVRRGGRLDCVWPLYISRVRFKSVARHPGCGAYEEYAGPLFRDGPGAAEVLRAALTAAKGLADLLQVYNVPEGSLAAQVLADDRAHGLRSSVSSPVISLKAFDDFESWVKTKSKNFRAALRNDRRRLQDVGVVEFREMVGPVDGARCVDWMFENKRQWARERKISHSWIHDDLGHAFFKALAVRTPQERPARPDTQFFALLLDDKIISAGIGLVSHDRIEYFMSAVDSAYNYYSPGNQFVMEYATVAIGMGLDYDFRITTDPYKLRWTDRFDRYDSFWIACTPRGLISIARQRVRGAIYVLRVKLGPHLKKLLRRGRA